jgi:uncharacterized coiled-coil protein SlyX
MEDKELDGVYGRINKIDSRVTKLETSYPFLEDLIERSTKTNEKLSETMQEVQISMSKLNDKLDYQSDALKAMKEESEEANKKMNEHISQVAQKVEKIEDKGKFDIWQWLKSNFPWIVALVGLGAYSVSQFVKF